MSKPKVALALSGGGARGIAHIGVIQVLLERGYEIHSIAGTSMGSLVGGIYALGKLNAFTDWMLQLDRREIFRLVDFTITDQGFIKGDKVFGEVQEFIPDSRIEDLAINYVAVAANLTQRKLVVFREGSVYDAIRASVSIPTVFTPVQRDKDLLVDGGVLNNLPLDLVHREEGDLLVAVNVNADIPYEPPEVDDEEEKKSIYQKKLDEFVEYFQGLFPKDDKTRMGYFELLTNTLELMMQYRDRRMLEQHPPDILIETSHDACDVFDFYKAEEMIAVGRMQAEQALNKSL